MRKIVYAINNYFFDADEVSASDALWFYGIICVMILAGLVAVI